jgi:hypothetical protein
MGERKVRELLVGGVLDRLIEQDNHGPRVSSIHGGGVLVRGAGHVDAAWGLSRFAESAAS